jgi:hypothetical protein
VSTVPPSVASFRSEYREKEIGRFYSGWGHFSFTSLGSLAVIAFAISRLHEVQPLEWLTVPATFLFANLAEYLGHKGPMHHRRPVLGILYERHTLSHHHYFTNEAMAYESSRDFKMVLFPPIMLFFFLGVLAVPPGAALFALLSPNVGWLYVTVAMSYFLTYEWLHFVYHLDEGSLVGRLPFVRFLRRHHQAHHDLALMGRWNFNITFPISDLVFGTFHRRG